MIYSPASGPVRGSPSASTSRDMDGPAQGPVASLSLSYGGFGVPAFVGSTSVGGWEIPARAAGDGVQRMNNGDGLGDWKTGFGVGCELSTGEYAAVCVLCSAFLGGLLSRTCRSVS